MKGGPCTRRTFLGVTATVGLPLVSGCLSDDDEPLDLPAGFDDGIDSSMAFDDDSPTAELASVTVNRDYRVIGSEVLERETKCYASREADQYLVRERELAPSPEAIDARYFDGNTEYVHLDPGTGEPFFALTSDARFNPGFALLLDPIRLYAEVIEFDRSYRNNDGNIRLRADTGDFAASGRLGEFQPDPPDEEINIDPRLFEHGSGGLTIFEDGVLLEVSITAVFDPPEADSFAILDDIQWIDHGDTSVPTPEWLEDARDELE